MAQEYITISAEEVNEEERARVNRARETHVAIGVNLSKMISSYLDYFNEDEQYQLSLILISQGLNWFHERNYKKEMKNLCLGYLETLCSPETTDKKDLH
jgi:hypothetical protein